MMMMMVMMMMVMMTTTMVIMMLPSSDDDDGDDDDDVTADGVLCFGRKCFPLAFGVPAVLMVISTGEVFLLFASLNCS